MWHLTVPVTEWFTAHPGMMSLFLPPYSPFLNPTEKIFSSQKWKVWDCQQQDQMSFLAALSAGCVWTFLQKTARDGSGMQKDYFPGVLQGRTYEVFCG